MYFLCIIICRCYVTQYFLDKLAISSELPSHNDMNRWYDQIVFVASYDDKESGTRRKAPLTITFLRDK